MKKEIRNRVFSIIGILTFLIVMTSYVYLPNHTDMLSSLAFLKEEKSFYIEELSDAILLNDVYPTQDKEGLLNTPYVFKVINNSNADINYRIVFNNNKEKAKSEYNMEVLDNKYLRYNLTDNSTDDPKTLPEDSVIYEGVIEKNSNKTFEFKMWLSIDSDAGAMNKMFIGSINIEKIEK